eukprot:36284_1
MKFMEDRNLWKKFEDVVTVTKMFSVKNQTINDKQYKKDEFITDSINAARKLPSNVYYQKHSIKPSRIKQTLKVWCMNGFEKYWIQDHNNLSDKQLDELKLKMIEFWVDENKNKRIKNIKLNINISQSKPIEADNAEPDMSENSDEENDIEDNNNKKKIVKYQNFTLVPYNYATEIKDILKRKKLNIVKLINENNQEIRYQVVGQKGATTKTNEIKVGVISEKAAKAFWDDTNGTGYEELFLKSDCTTRLDKFSAKGTVSFQWKENGTMTKKNETIQSMELICNPNQMTRIKASYFVAKGKETNVGTMVFRLNCCDRDD